MEEIFSNKSVIVALDYKTEKDIPVNFLFDYSKHLMNNKIIDDKISGWEHDNADLLKKFGVEKAGGKEESIRPNNKFVIRCGSEEESDDEFFKLTLASGNFKEAEILNNLLLNKTSKSLIPNGKKGKNKKQMLKRKRKSSSQKIMEISPQAKSIQFEFVNPNTNNNEESSEKNTENNQSVSAPSISVQRNKKESNKIISKMNNFDDEAFGNIIKEFLNINDFPTEPKDKVGLLRKFISIYKKIKADKAKLNNFMKKISEKFNEPIEEIQSLFEFEYLRNKREGAFANLSKLINKFSTILAVNRITDIRHISVITENSLVKDKYSHVQNKIADYIIAYKDIFKFFEKDQKAKESNEQLIDKYIPTFKLSKFSSEEGKEKIFKKIKEFFNKNKIVYDDSVIVSMVPKDEGEMGEQWSKSYKDITEVDKLTDENRNNLNENEFINNFFGNCNSLNFLNPNNITNPPNIAGIDSNLSIIGNMITNSKFLINSQNNPNILNKETLLLNFSEQNFYSNGNKLIYNPNLMKQLSSLYIFNTVTADGVKIPVKSNNYLIKEYDKCDFLPDDDEK